MKLKMFFIFLIGMIGFTSMASTPLMEQKQKTTFCKDYQVLTIVENVQSIAYDVLALNITSNLSVSYKTQLSGGNEPITSYAIINDVGWQFSKFNYINIPYFEKLNPNYNLHFKHLLYIAPNHIRDKC